MPASVTTRTSWPPCRALDQLRHPGLLVALEERQHPAGRRLTPRSAASRCSRRVSSAAITRRGGQRPGQPGRGVAGPAQRRAGQHHPAGRRRCCAGAGPAGGAVIGGASISTDPTITEVTAATLQADAHPPGAGPAGPDGAARAAPVASGLGRAAAGCGPCWSPRSRPAPGSGRWAFPRARASTRSTTPPRPQELLRYGYEDNRGYMFIVHPPLGKWLIAATSVAVRRRRGGLAGRPGDRRDASAC